MKTIINGIICTAAVAMLAGCGAGAGKPDKYAYEPPKDNYFLKYTETRDGNLRGTHVIARIGEDFTHGEEGDLFTHISGRTKKGYMRNPEDGQWWGDPYYEYSEYTGDADDVGIFATFNDGPFHYLTLFGTPESFSDYYVGSEKVAGVNCWVFDCLINGQKGKYWVDPSNGCTLKAYYPEKDETLEVVEYDLNYSEWGDNLIPADYDAVKWP